LCVSIITVVCLERWVCFLVGERTRLPLPSTHDEPTCVTALSAEVSGEVTTHHIQVRGPARSMPALAPEGPRGLRSPTSALRAHHITVGCHRASQSVPTSNLVPSVLNSSSIICSKVFPSSSFATLTSLPCSSTYSASTSNSATLATTSSSTISPFLS
jgi:hypothetical protein